jgi:hypothetical protein
MPNPVHLVFLFTTPAKNSIVGRRIAVSGIARSGGTGGFFQVDEVRVGVAGGDGVIASRVLGSWSCELTVPPAVLGGSPLRLHATATGTLTTTSNNLAPPGPDPDPDPHPDPDPDPDPGTPHTEPFTQTIFLDVVLDGSVPLVMIDPFDSPVLTEPGQPHVLDLSGTATDDETGITTVRLKLDDGPFADVADVVDIGPGRKSWRQKAVEVPAGEHQFCVEAVNGADTAGRAFAQIAVRLPIEPGPVEQAFESTRYLFDLRDLALRYVEVNGSAGVLTTAMLARRFHQPLDRLTERASFEEATAPVAQARIAIEVLRRELDAPASAALDTRFRALAYQTFLRVLGTSYDELRLARNAEDATRQKLADRLGIGVLAAKPDRLDELTVSPEAITNKELAALSGYRSTAVGDPLRPAAPAAKVLLWRRDALRAGWRHDDEVQRDAADGPRPIIDPDIVGDDDIRNKQPTDPAFSLWTARVAWTADNLNQIDHRLSAGADRLASFDKAVRKFLGVIDLSSLADKEADGVDIESDIRPLDLTLDAFRFLARSRALLADGILLDTELDDVAAILLQVQKRREYRAWRSEERSVGLVLEPALFVLDDTIAISSGVSRWRFSRAEYLDWRRTLASRTTAAATLESSYAHVIEATESSVLPQLRDALVSELSAESETPEEAAERLTRHLLIDLRADAGQRTSRVEQAVETLQAMLFAARSGGLGPDASGREWTVDDQVRTDASGTVVRDFDSEWDWLSDYRSWLSASRVFAYPENQLLPAVYVADRDVPSPTAAFRDADGLIENLRKQTTITPEQARNHAAAYVRRLRAELPALPDGSKPLPDGFVLTDQLTNPKLRKLQTTSATMTRPEIPHLEIFWLVPLAIAGKLQESGQFQAALDWYQTMYAYQLQPDRRIYFGLTLENQPSSYERVPEWLITEMNPHLIARKRQNCYTKATIMAIAGCFQAFADAEFTRDTAVSNARARTLYETALDLLNLDEAKPETGPGVPYAPNPVWQSMIDRSRAGLEKIHRGLNIAGAKTPGVTFESALPSQHRYAVLVERAKNLVAIAQQVEAAYLSALEQHDAKTYDALRARNDLEVAAATTAMHDLRVADAGIGINLAALQRERAQLQADHYDELIRAGRSGWEQAGLYSLQAAAILHGVSAAAKTFSLGFFEGGGVDQLAEAASTVSQVAQTIASFERREEEWRFQRSLAQEDRAVGDQQVQLAVNQFQLALKEQGLAVLQHDHAAAVATFLATRFTSAELFEWMSGVLGRVYAFFLQQATALARLAEAQLAFERQELPTGFIAADYWRDATAGAAVPDRRGLTGSARLLEDVHRLDQFAFDTDRRKLHITQTFPLSQIAAAELQQLRDTGVVTFATPQELFDREFPGHYLRLIKRVKVSLVALVPAGRGVRATLSASGLSRSVVARGPFDTVGLRRQPESIAFTSPTNATGMFDLEPENGLLLPFEGMGVDTVWQLELPKAANPFDFRTIADVVLTIEYTALDSSEYRQRVVRELDRRFSGDRTFSIRNQFPDAWYELNNPETVDPERRMRAVLNLTLDDFPPHIRDLRVQHLAVYVLRKDELSSELAFDDLTHTVGSQTTKGGEAETVGGIVSTRRPGGSAWAVHLGADPAGSWELAVTDDPIVRSWFTDELIDDIAIVMTISGTTPEWP